MKGIIMDFNSKTYAMYSVSADSATYSGPLNTVSVTDHLRLARVAPVPQKAFSGVSRRSASFTRSHTLAQGGSHPSKLAVDGSFAVGVSNEDVDALIADFRGFVASAHFVDFVKAGKIYEDKV
ncbi:TPA_asm: coat protein [ssRNA phage SRR6050698_1]|uniref:Coat protein n=1 Tax=ssRNA phage SRR6050698_1 TaxID=2786482 RepID=A0A8S5L522_9VIRU|nr:coat protein [ssRNA phage SRR6050698_1]DAD52524.1 TPA_asm: coat protein [ssRNA phage SRR6050698_1]